MSSQTLKFACLCRKITGEIIFSSSDTRPVAHICHCFVCRHASGTLCTTKIINTDSPFTINYYTSEPFESHSAIPDITLSFCGNCGSSIFEKYEVADEIAFNTGILEDPDGTIELRYECCSRQTEDGGLSTWLELPDSATCLMHHGEASRHRPATQSCKSSETSAFCFCRGVSLKITPPREASTAVSSPYSDLIRPFHLEPSENPEDEKWWLRANGTKYFAGTCACKSCRLASGNDVQAWAFIPKVNIRQHDDMPLDFSMTTLKQYESSKGVYRNFCGSCGATVFWHDETRPELIDVAAGLLDARSGARAEELLEWATERVSFEEDAQNKDLVAKLGVGIRAWAKTTSERHVDETWRAHDGLVGQ